MLEVLRNMKRVPARVISHKFIFESIIKEHGYKFSSGNPAIMNQLSNWRAVEEEIAMSPQEMTSVRDYLGN